MKIQWRLLFLLFTSAALVGVVHAGPYSLRGVQIDRSRVGQAASGSGYQVQACVSPQQAQSSHNGAQFVILVGVMDDSKPQFNAARLWALYE